MTNFGAGHETRSHKIGCDRLAYPHNHIEVDNRLMYFLGRLEARYEASLYVHLKRDIEATARSFQKRLGQNRCIISAYDKTIIQNNKNESFDLCVDYVCNANANIEAYLKGKKHIEFQLDSPNEGVENLWEFIGAEGDIGSAKEEFNTKWNASRKD